MSELVCYIDRAERGMLPVRLRLISTRVDESWPFPEVLADDRAALQRGLGDAADWIAAQLKTHGRAGLGAIVLDGDGTRCGWVTTVSADAEAIGSMLRQAAEPVSDEDAAHTVGSTPQLALGPEARITGARSYQPMGGTATAAKPGLLAKPPAAGVQQRQRFGVTAVPDATIRLLLDELDARSVDVTRVVTVWQALAEAFGTPGTADSLVASCGATAAQVCIVPDEGRLLWGWSRGGQPIAAGSFRLPQGYPTPSGPSGVSLTGAELARLASEWVAWSTQLGASPSRVRVLMPDDTWQDESSLGERLASVWPGATADIAFDADPLGVALSRFADGLADPRLPDAGHGAIAALATRPGRQHRSMYRWAAIAIVIAAGVMGVAAFGVHKTASEAAEKADELHDTWRTTAGELVPGINDGAWADAQWDATVIQDVQGQLDALRKAVAPVSVTPEKPILPELETLSLVLGNPDYTVESVSLTATAVSVVVVVPDTGAYEELVSSLESIGGSAIRSWSPTPTPRGDGIRVSLIGQWGEPRRTTPAAGGTS